MNMGGPDDHWYSDLFTWDRPAFGERIDSLIRDIQRFGGDALLRDEEPLGQRLWNLWPRWWPVDEDLLDQLEVDLRHVRDGLRAEAHARGWDLE